VQPTSSRPDTVPAGEACAALAEALDQAQSRLSCPAPDRSPTCPELLHVAGALPCDEVRQDTLEACVGIIGGYTRCADFDQRPCIVTIEPGSCRSPEPPARDGGDAGGMGGQSGTDSGPGGSPGGGTDAGGSAGAGGSGDGGPEAGLDASGDGSPLDASDVLVASGDAASD
jgi:hypothetical protein